VWASVSTKTNRKRNKAGAKPTEATAVAAAPKGPASETITVDAKKIGIIIGPKGSTMQALQAATGCKLDVNAPPKDAAKPSSTATVVITASTDAGVTSDFGLAKAAIRELERNGYAKILQGEDFAENSISVHPRYLSEIVGAGGKTIKAIQTELDVKVKIPPTDWKPNTPQVGKTPPSVRIGIAGSNDNVKQAKQVIQAIVKDHCHPITHPGLVSEQTYVAPEFFHCVIGRGGSEIKHIKGNYQVEVYMPGNDSDSENVIVVGKQTNVDRAIGHIQKLIDLDSEQRAQKYSDDDIGGGGGWGGDVADDLDGW
jgi:polyribonucleotide nucleotidyltransferase